MADPVIIDLIEWLKENLPDAQEEDLFKKVRRVQKVFDLLMGLSFEQFYNYALNLHREDDQETATLEQIIDSKLVEMKEYVDLNEEMQSKTEKLDASTAQLDLKKEHYNLITSIRLDQTKDLITRYNCLISKK